MARYQGTTKQRGLGADHVADKKRLLALHRDGDPCWRCGQPMLKSQELHRDHVIDRARGGADGPAVLAHAKCNLSAGARAGNHDRGFRPASAMVPSATCRTCGKPYRRAARSCEVCGIHYHPNGPDQRTCSRAHGTELRRRLYGPAGRRSTGRPPAQPKLPKPRRERQNWPVSRVAYYTCRYCGKLGVTRPQRQPREVCPARPCQLLRIQANNLRTRHGAELPPGLIAAVLCAAC